MGNFSHFLDWYIKLTELYSCDCPKASALLIMSKSSLTKSLLCKSWYENDLSVDYLDFGWLDLFAIADSDSTEHT